MQEEKSVPTRKRLAQLIEELTPEEQSVAVALLEAMIANLHCNCEEKLAKAGPFSTLWEAGIDAQEWVDHLRGHKNHKCS